MFIWGLQDQLNAWRRIVLEMDMQVASSVRDMEQLDHPVDCASVDGINGAQVVGCSVDKGRDWTMTGETQGGTGNVPTARLCSDRVYGTSRSRGKSNRELLTEWDWF